MKKLLSFCVVISMLFSFFVCNAYAIEASEVNISAPSALLMDYSTGKIIYEKNPDDFLNFNRCNALAPACAS